MNQIRMIEISLNLGKLYRDKAAASFKEWQLTQDAEARMLAMTPPEDWPGKNEGARKTAAQQAYATDPALIEITKALAAARGQILSFDAEIQALEAERRGLEWAIRGQLVEKMSVIGVQSNGRGDPAETAFDDSAGYQVDQAAFQPIDDSLPF